MAKRKCSRVRGQSTTARQLTAAHGASACRLMAPTAYWQNSLGFPSSVNGWTNILFQVSIPLGNVRIAGPIKIATYRILRYDELDEVCFHCHYVHKLRTREGGADIEGFGIAAQHGRSAVVNRGICRSRSRRRSGVFPSCFDNLLSFLRAGFNVSFNCGYVTSRGPYPHVHPAGGGRQLIFSR